jgi:hypothetical protein
MVRQPVLGVEALHLFKAVGAVYATAHAYRPGFGHEQSAQVYAISVTANGYSILAHIAVQFGITQKNYGHLREKPDAQIK